MAAWSRTELRFMAERSPMGIATIAARKKAVRPSSRVAAMIAAHHGEGGLPEVQGAAEVEPEGVAEEDRVLDGERSIEAEIATHPLHLADGRVGGQEKGHGITREPHDDEDDGGDEPESDQGAEEPLDDERKKSTHGESPSPLPSPGAGRGQEQGRLYARRNLKLKRRISNCWFGFGVQSTYFCSP